MASVAANKGCVWLATVPSYDQHPSFWRLCVSFIRLFCDVVLSGKRRRDRTNTSCKDTKEAIPKKAQTKHNDSTTETRGGRGGGDVRY